MKALFVHSNAHSTQGENILYIRSGAYLLMLALLPSLEMTPPHSGQLLLSHSNLLSSLDLFNGKVFISFDPSLRPGKSTLHFASLVGAKQERSLTNSLTYFPLGSRIGVYSSLFSPFLLVTP